MNSKSSIESRVLFHDSWEFLLVLSEPIGRPGRIDPTTPYIKKKSAAFES